MKNILSFIILILILSSGTYGDELVWKYTNPWSGSFIMKFNTVTEKIHLTDLSGKNEQVAALCNGTNFISYIETLLTRIDGESIGDDWIDGELSIVTLIKGDKTITRKIYIVDPPGCIPFNDGYTADRELTEVDKFKQTLDGFLIRDMLFKVRKAAFPEKTE